MKTTERKSKILDICFEVEVVYDSIRATEGADADGLHGAHITEWIVREVEVLTKVPKEVRQYLETCAVEQFNEEYNKLGG